MLENNEEKVNIQQESQEKINDAVDVVENEVANAAEKDDEKHQIPMLDYASMELEKLVEELQKLLESYPVQQLKANVDSLKFAFNSKFGKLLAEKKEAFLAEGGNSIDFQFSSPVKSEYNKLLGEYKTKRDAYYNQLEKQLKENLEKRNTLIEELKQLIENANSNTMYNDFQQIQNRWKAIGPVSKTKYNDTWKTFHHHVERFYDLLHLNKDLRELDFKHNLDEKLKLIERAEGLLKIEDVNVAFKELQLLHKMWKEEVGPVSKEYREEVWGKFSAATKKLHDKRHDHYRNLKSKYQEMIDAKLLVVAEINAFDTSGNKTHKDWQKSITEIESLRQKYFDIGKLPYSKSEAVWQQFKEATKKFNAAKNAFYKSEKSAQSTNLKKKMELVELAESLKDSEDWDETTNTMKRIQSDWKKIGHVPRKYSDDIWNRFKGACNHYFDRLHERKNELNKEQQVVVDAKKAFIEELKEKESISLDEVKEAIGQWKDLGFLPRNARHLDGKFNKVIDAHLEKQNLSREEIAMLKFKNVVDTYLAQEDYRKLDSEQLFLRRKIDETVREMQQLENNLSFISNATEDNPLVKNVRAGIQGFKDELDIWQAKLDYLRGLNY
ncbi:Chromosome segregation protein [Tenacibaculum sp. 190130A14a]|uniref:Chromosome segregation protein n=1 Tax=Tenacibaculum polynesiense TaxID=3137857 RepID=A0ABM9PFR3_9FLAO